MLRPCLKWVSMISEVSLLAGKTCLREIFTSTPEASGSITSYRKSMSFMSLKPSTTALIFSGSNISSVSSSTGFSFNLLQALLSPAFLSRFSNAFGVNPPEFSCSLAAYLSTPRYFIIFVHFCFCRCVILFYTHFFLTS